ATRSSATNICSLEPSSFEPCSLAIGASTIWSIDNGLVAGDGAFAARRPQIGVDHRWVGADIFGRAFGDDLTGGEAHDPVADSHDDVHIVFDEHDSQAVIGETHDMSQQRMRQRGAN